MQAGNIAVANVYESIVDAEVTVLGNTVTLRARTSGGQLGTLTSAQTALYTTFTTMFTPLLLPVDWLP